MIGLIQKGTILTWQAVLFLVSFLPKPSLRSIVYAGILFLFLNIYFLIHLFFGHNSLFYYWHLLNIKSEKEILLSQVEEANNTLVSEINLLYGKDIDVDYLEELAKKKLNYSYSDERVIIMGGNETK